jgi:hypothetical protein
MSRDTGVPCSSQQQNNVSRKYIKMLLIPNFRYFVVKLLKSDLSTSGTLRSTIIKKSTKNTEALFLGRG